MDYADFTVEASDVKTLDNGKRIQFRLRVLEEMQADEAVVITCEERALQRIVDRLEKRDLTAKELIDLGRSLGALLLPVDDVRGKPSVREMFARRLQMPGGVGVRLRLRFPRTLAGLPWEYSYVERAGGDGLDGFLALDPRVAFVRDDVLGTLPITPFEGDLRIVAALASAAGLPVLEVDTELQYIKTAVKDLQGVTLTPVENATLERVQAELPGAQIFHFAGHGEFAREMGDLPGTYTGTGSLAFEDARVGAEQFAVNLHGQRVQLAVLAGCETGRRAGINVWSGIAPALTKVDIPAVVANQYSITDTAAVAFSRSFYEALAGGLPIEAAVSRGRLAIFNQDTAGRDWGVPVLYLRAANGLLFTGVGSRANREQARAAAEADFDVRTGKVGAQGVVYGAKVRELLAGALSISVTTGDVAGRVVGGEFGSVEGGTINTTVNTGDVTGEVIGGMFESVGGGGRRRGARSGPRPAPPPTAEAAPAPTPVPRSSTTVTTGNVSGGGTVVGTINGPVTIVSGKQGLTPTIEEKIRLDVATATNVVMHEPFMVVVAVKQPGAPVLAEADLGHVQSADGSIFRAEEEEEVLYKVEISGAGFIAERNSHVFRLRLGRDSSPIAFQVTATKAGKHPLFVTAYQLGRLEPELAAQTRLTIEVRVAVQG